MMVHTQKNNEDGSFRELQQIRADSSRIVVTTNHDVVIEFSFNEHGMTTSVWSHGKECVSSLRSFNSIANEVLDDN